MIFAALRIVAYVLGIVGTALALPLVYKIGWLNVFLVSSAMLLLWSAAAFAVARRRKR